MRLCMEEGVKLKRPYRNHLNSSNDLRTTYEATRAGFIQLALERNRRATPFVAEARALRSAASSVTKPHDLLNIPDIQQGLLTAAGVSDKAAKYLGERDRREAIVGLIEHYLLPQGETFIEELIFRFLLTRGDTLGGSMRNVGGFMAKKKLSRAIIAYLRIAGKACEYFDSRSKTWLPLPEDDTDIEDALNGLSWSQGKSSRTLIYNVNVPFVRNNIDFCLLDCQPHDRLKDRISEPNRYLALGELKGGIDPAGADEHWKTARTALSRISSEFSKLEAHPHTFFIGAAIESKMSDEIWSMLEKGIIENAANLNEERQIVSITEWLCKL